MLEWRFKDGAKYIDMKCVFWDCSLRHRPQTCYIREYCNKRMCKVPKLNERASQKNPLEAETDELFTVYVVHEWRTYVVRRPALFNSFKQCYRFIDANFDEKALRNVGSYSTVIECRKSQCSYMLKKAYEKVDYECKSKNGEQKPLDMFRDGVMDEIYDLERRIVSDVTVNLDDSLKEELNKSSFGLITELSRKFPGLSKKLDAITLDNLELE